MPTENRSTELLSCPFCKAAMRIESNRDWHRLMGEHDEECVFLDPEVMMVPATDEQRELLVRDWNRRGQAAEQNLSEPVAYVLFRNGGPDYGCDGIVISNVRGDTLGDGDSWEPVYTHADRGEVERWKRRHEGVKLQRNEYMAERDNLRATLTERDAQLAWWKNHLGVHLSILFGTSGHTPEEADKSADDIIRRAERLAPQPSTSAEPGAKS